MTKPVVGWFEVTGKDGPALQSSTPSCSGGQ